MGDSETECSHSPSECDSPILYKGQSYIDQLVLPKEDPFFPKTPECAAKLSVTTQAMCSETQDNFGALSQGLNTLDILNGLDSLLGEPIHHKTGPNNTTVNKILVPRQFTRMHAAYPVGKVRSLDKVIAKIPKGNVTQVSLANCLDAQDMKLLISACGETNPTKATKQVLCEKLSCLIASGTLSKVLNTIQGGPKAEISGNSLMNSQRLKCDELDTFIGPSQPSQLIKRTLSEGDTPLSLSRATFVSQGDSKQWVPVTDAALLSELEGISVGSSVAKHHFPASQRSTGVYFADQPTEMWTDCSQEMQQLLQESDPSRKFTHMLQRLCESKIGKFSGLDLNGLREEASTASDSSVATAACPGGEASGLDFAGLVDSFRARLKTATAPSTLGSIASTNTYALSAEEHTQMPQRTASTDMMGCDALKVAVFKKEKLGLSLIMQSVPASSSARVVIQAKNHGLLDPAVDKLLSVGDELVSVQGQPLTVWCKSGSDSSDSYAKLLEYIKCAARPLQLGFVPAGNSR